MTRMVNGFTDFPGAAELSTISDTAAAAAATESVTAASAAELLAVGVNVNFAPDADVLPESRGPSGVDDRSFGSDPERTGTLVAAAVRGYQSAGLAATVKHFPGIGRLATDTHKALPSLDDQLRGVELGRIGADAGRRRGRYRAGDDRPCADARGRRDRAVIGAEPARWSPICCAVRAEMAVTA